ncbi:MAG: Gfo/Idh/MocA family oxidoreductase [Acidobacteria bacterium]|nr:Gfo/Idh/MocA family oxidoreductase [Acidobacteriota bacterium]MBU1338466.1 Gfo/Idh/MocA family oxidoreductase [Acidobacteriota bacterium]MBU1474653.1 Gfo/Idh/MocA family oxidoreductase [Acidobacteriota bacterium]MBU4331406.1 Gfo/Idh/MocA family oxidoreductase [Acidobacteriota bacterium]MBU4494437.1 Gfo/Idh/MocA family oxidoreductase [Acidobacteriota bacterium]
MPEHITRKDEPSHSRRRFIKSSAAAGLGMALTASTLRGSSASASLQESGGGDQLNIALIGAGAQGRVLIESCLRIPDIRFKAVCDIWEYSQRYAERYLKKYGHEAGVYEDYREMLAREKDLDAVIVASPDGVHAEHANAAMRAGLHVYCEKEMSNSLTKARSMVRTARETNKLLQIGHQRRSNPRYLHAINRLILEHKILGRVTKAYAQWNRAKSDMLGWPRQYTLSADTLAAYGYSSMTAFRNWRWFKKYGGGPIVDLGSHQIDLFSWIFGVLPSTVTASGGTDYYPGREWYDNVMAIYEFETEEGTARALYQVQTMTKHGGFYEVFMGDNGSLVISEVPQLGDWAMREAHAPEWDSLVKEGLLKSETQPIRKVDTTNIFLDVRVTAEAGRWPLPVELAKPAHQPHLENFFDAVRNGTKLNCPPEIGYETAVAVLKVNESIENRRRCTFTPEQFKA